MPDRGIRPLRRKRIDVEGELERYSRQILFKEIGEAAQRRLLGARAVLIGCGALGTVLADTLVRAGLGFLRIVDRDYVELNNLQRQVLFTEADARGAVPKAVAAARRLGEVDARARIEPVIADADATNIETLVASCGVILDGTDNFETRFLINDAAVKHGIPWVYGACIGAEGMVLPIVPGVTACLRCVWEAPPPPGSSPTCDTAGVLAPIVHIVASLQALEAIKLLTGRHDALLRDLVQIDAWAGRFERFDLQAARDQGDCPCCKQARYDYLAAGGSRTAGLCGRDAVQIAPRPDTCVDFDQIAARLAGVAKSPPLVNRYLLRFEVDAYLVTLFRDGRAIIKGTSSPEEGRTIYARYIGA